MNTNVITAQAIVAQKTTVATDEDRKALIAKAEAALADGTATEGLLAAACQAQDELDEAQDRREIGTVELETRRQEAVVAETEVPKSDEEARAKKFAADRENAATVLARKGESHVAAALRGQGHPNWCASILRVFLARFPANKPGTFDYVVRTELKAAEAAVAKEQVARQAAADIRAEKNRRYHQNRSLRATGNSRRAAGNNKNKQ